MNDQNDTRSSRLAQMSPLMLVATLFFLVLPAIRLGATPNDAFALALGERMPALLAKYHVPGAVICCVTNGDVAWTEAFGLADLKAGTPMRPDMVFNHGSNGKFLTMWGIMRLVEQGKLDLDAPANQYLKQWKIRSSQFDPSGVTIRRLLTHTAGLSVSGFIDYSPRRKLPTLVEMLEGKNQIELFGAVNGPVFIKWQPGSRQSYSGGGYVILQMIIEDVTGEPFATFMQREVTGPLGLDIEWVWTRELEKKAPRNYGEMGEEVGYRKLGCQSIGSEVCTVPDFARIVGAMATGPHGEPAGRGVLKPESINTMLDPLPAGLGFAYSITNMQAHPVPNSANSDRVISHSGRNSGWTAFFLFDTTKRTGFVIANNSLLGLDLNSAVERIWLKTVLGLDAGDAPPPGATFLVSINSKAEKIAFFLWLFLLLAVWRCIAQLAMGRRRLSRPRVWRALLLLSLPGLLLLVWWYVFYAPQSMPLPLPTTYLSLWRLPLINYITALLSGWLGVALFFTLCPRTFKMIKSDADA